MKKSYLYKSCIYSNPEKPKKETDTIKEEKEEEDNNEITIVDTDKEVKPITGRSFIREQSNREPIEKEKLLQNAFNMINESSYEIGPLNIPFIPKSETLSIPLDL